MTEKYMTVRDYARLIGQTESNIRKAIRGGRIEAVATTCLNYKQWLIPFSEAKNYIDKEKKQLLISLERVNKAVKELSSNEQ
jgi:hypothetical protein